MKKNFRNYLMIGSIAALILTLASCSKNNDSGNNTPVAGLMAFNLAPDMKGIGITLSGNTLPGSPLLYTNYTGVYLSAFPGERSIRAYDYFMARPITASTATLEAGKYHSLFVVGANNNYTNLVTQDNIDSLKANGQAYIRYINAIPDSTKLEVSVDAGGKEAVKEHAAFKNVSAFVPVDAGRVTININNGNDVQAGRVISVDPNKIYTVLLTGLPSAKDSALAAQIRYIENGTITESAGDKTAVSANASITN